MIDLTIEVPLSLTQATKAIPAIDGRRPAISTVWRWMRKGVRGVHLEYVRLGNRVATSKEALSRFANNLAAADLGREQSPTPLPRSKPPTNAARRASIEQAEAGLREAGILR